MTEDKKARIKKIQKLFALNVLKDTLGCVAMMIFAFYTGILLMRNNLLDKEMMTFYVSISAWIFFLGCCTGVSEQYDIMKEEIKKIEEI